MTDENDLGKCGITEAYIDQHIDNLSAGDLDLIEKIGIQLSHDEALIYANMPEFHRAFLEGAYSWHVLRIWLHSYSRNDSQTVSRLSRYLRLVERKADLVMPINDVVSLVFPFEHGAGLSFSVDLGAALSPERRFLVDVVSLVKRGWLNAINISVTDLHTKVVLGEGERSGVPTSVKNFNNSLPNVVIRLSDLEQISYRLKSEISQRAVKVWRQYVDLHDADLKQGALLNGGDKAPAMPSAPKPKQEINIAWQRRLNLMRTKNNKLSYHAACKTLSEQLKGEGEKKCSVNTIKTYTNKW